MSSPTDIPNFGGGGGSSSNGGNPADGIRNDTVRAAIEAVQAEPGTAATIDVLRSCLAGYLLLDVTGSDLQVDDNGEIAEGSTINIRGGEGPDEQPAIFAFTSQEQLAAMYAENTDDVQVQSLVQEAPGVLELVMGQEASWLVLDPAGPSVALAKDDLEFALRVPRNDALRAALEPGTPREALLAALAAEGPLSLAVDAPDLEAGEQDSAEVQVRSVEAPDGNGPALAVFTSGPEVLAGSPEDKIATQSTAEIVQIGSEGGFAGIVINPAGPWAYVTADELRALRG